MEAERNGDALSEERRRSCRRFDLLSQQHVSIFPFATHSSIYDVYTLVMHAHESASSGARRSKGEEGRASRRNFCRVKVENVAEKEENV